MTRVLVFGVFDRLHEGHRFFLTKARELGTDLTVCLAQDEIVQELKGHRPRQAFKERENALKSLESVDAVIPGDLSIGTYSCLENAKPDVIALGYDQEALQKDLTRWIEAKQANIRLAVVAPHKPEIYKSSLL